MLKLLWITNNIGVLIALGVLVFGLVGTWVKYGSDITQLKKDADKSETKVEKLGDDLRLHLSDTSLHIDPARDEKRWAEFKGEILRRLDRLEEKIEKLMIVQHP